MTWLRYVVFALLVVPTTLLIRGRSGLDTKSVGMQSLRGLAVAGSAVLFILCLTLLPVAENTAINFISPIFITALSFPLLGEKVGMRRWAAAAVGFAGVLIVVQPGGSGFSAAALLPIGAAMSWAVAAIVARKMHAERPEVTLAWSAIIGLIVLSLGVPFVWKSIALHEIGIGVLMGLFSTVGHGLVILAFRKAQASVLAPFSYVQLASSSLLSFFLFAAVPQQREGKLLIATLVGEAWAWTATALSPSECAAQRRLSLRRSAPNRRQINLVPLEAALALPEFTARDRGEQRLGIGVLRLAED